MSSVIGLAGAFAVALLVELTADPGAWVIVLIGCIVAGSVHLAAWTTRRQMRSRTSGLPQ